MAEVPIGLQLYTVRNELEKDFEGTLRQVAEIGYAGVEFAGCYDHSASEIAGLTKELGLRPVAAHVSIDELEGSLEEVVEFHLEVGCQFLVIPSLPAPRRRDRKKWRSAAVSLSEIGTELQDYGLRLCYHNHTDEFREYAGHLGFDLLFETAAANALFAELDVYWIQHADRDPLEYVRKMANRCPLLHLKDMAGNVEREYTEVGEGTIDFEAIFAAAEAGGVEWYFVEQDECARPPLESARISFENLKKMGKA